MTETPPLTRIPSLGGQITIVTPSERAAYDD
jgi:hypothetical protein